MTGEEYPGLRESMGMTQKMLAGHLGAHWNTIARRERGEMPIDREAEIAVRAARRTAIAPNTKPPKYAPPSPRKIFPAG